MSQSAGTWTVVTISGKTADVYEPPDVESCGSAVIYLHDDNLATPVNDSAFTGQFEKARLPCVCPHGGRSWWLDVVCREFDDRISPLMHVRQQVLPWIERHWHLTPPRIGLLGTGMGGQGALQLAYRAAGTFPVVAAISPAIDFHILHGQGSALDEMFSDPEAARQQTATLHLHPLNWPRQQLLVCDPADPLWFDGCQRLASKLSSIGIPFESDLMSSAAGGREGYSRSMAERCVPFVAEGLHQTDGR